MKHRKFLCGSCSLTLQSRSGCSPYASLMTQGQRNVVLDLVTALKMEH